MRNIISCRQSSAYACGLALLLLALTMSGCARGGVAANDAAGGADAEQVLSELDTLTNDLLKKVETARDPVSGLADALVLLDARKVALAARIAAVKSSRRFQQDNELRRHALESEIDNVIRVQGLRTKYLNETGNPEFRTRLDKLINDYQDLFKS
ncbi:MAG: hypothetical protein WCD76_12645 [Pyrinomonadaceae bacterium]